MNRAPSGPAIQIGGGIASGLGRRLGLRPENVKALLPVVPAAAIATVFKTSLVFRRSDHFTVAVSIRQRHVGDREIGKWKNHLSSNSTEVPVLS